MFPSTAGSDYTALVNQVLEFTSTSPQRQCIEIDILDDLEIELAEEFVVSIDQTIPGGVVSSVATVTILDSN
jgi:hypothetical protein